MMTRRVTDWMTIATDETMKILLVTCAVSAFVAVKLSASEESSVHVARQSQPVVMTIVTGWITIVMVESMRGLLVSSVVSVFVRVGLHASMEISDPVFQPIRSVLTSIAIARMKTVMDKSMRV